MKAVIAKSSSLDWVLKSTNFFQISDQGVLLTTLNVTLGDQSSIETQNNSRLSNDNVLDSIWLRVKNYPGGSQLIVTWRDRNTGIVQIDPVTKFNELEDMSFQISFDEKLLESLSYDYHSLTDRL
ncbi:hypothetical protein WJ972_10000 [Achromobacter insuavis]